MPTEIVKVDSQGVQIETLQLRPGSWVCSPAGCLGTCGSWPYLWTIGWGKTEKAAIASYERVNGWRARAKVAPSV